MRMGFDWPLEHSGDGGSSYASLKQQIQLSPTFYTMSMSFLNPLLSLHVL